MAGSTPIYGFPYPESSDLVANYPALGEQLAEDIESTISGLPAAGLTLVSPTSIANSGGSASASGGEVTFTGVSSVSLNGVFSASYLNYRIFILYTGSTGGSVLRMRLRASGTDNTNSTYDYAGFYMSFSGGSPTAAVAGTNLNAWPLAYTNNNANQRGLYVGDWSEPFAAEYTNFNGIQTTNYVQPSAGRFWATTSFNGFTIYPDAGNLTGSIRVYGYKNS